MAALLQTFPQQSTPISILQSQPSSVSGMLPASQNHVNHRSGNKSHTLRSSLHGMNNVLPLANYHGPSLVTSIAPYAFTSTPDLKLPSQNVQSNSVSSNDTNARALLANNVVAGQTETENYKGLSMRTSPMSSCGKNLAGHATQSYEESLATKPSIFASAQSPAPSLATQTFKAPPGRYRRTPSQSIDPQNIPGATQSPKNLNLELIPSCTFPDFSLQMPGTLDLSSNSTADAKQGHSGTSEPQRYRRRSLQNMNGSYAMAAPVPATNPSPLQSMIQSVRPYSSHRREESLESSISTQSSSPKINRMRRKGSLSSDISSSSQPSAVTSVVDSSRKKDISESIKIPPRSSSSDAVKRLVSPSPLSKPVILEVEAATKNSSAAVNTAPECPSVSPSQQIYKANVQSQATMHLDAENKKDTKKSKRSRLRRAISFGSAAELQKMTGPVKFTNNLDDKSDGRTGTLDNELDEEQAKIAEQQEAGWIGSGIYTGQGRFFLGSTDNLSISSTASSASIMIRKMGKGMKKSTRSLVGIFRPKNGMRASGGDPSTIASEPHVSVIEVEAEKNSTFQRIGPLNLESLKLEKTSPGKPVLGIETSFFSPDRLGSSCTENSASRKSTICGDNERVEVLAAVKKGILKRSILGTENSSIGVSSIISNNHNLQIPQTVTGHDSPKSNSPCSPNGDQQTIRRAASEIFGSEDYFGSTLRLGGSPKSHPETSQNSITKRNTTFSPRIQFYDTWPSREYDRRGEIATCNRLTPMLAQQIKEELNTFKMEMEVHENSKIYTHFF